jgi:hypothetical protein
MPDQRPNPLLDVLRAFESTEANVAKLERLWQQMQSHIPTGVAFGSDIEYERLRRAYSSVLEQVPAINGWRLSDSTLELNAIA